MEQQQQQEAFFAPRPPATEPPLELVLMAQQQQKKQQSAGFFFQNLVQQADVHLGRSILQRLFNKAAAAAGGEIMTLPSLEAALQTGPFQFLNAEQIQGIYAMADVDDKGYVTSEEWLTAATQTLRPSSA